MREVWLRISAAALVALLISGLLPVVTLAAVPDTTADAATVAEDGSVNIPVLDNDSTDAGALSVTAVTNPSDGTATIAGDGLSVDYLPDPNFHGSDSFTYVATNDDGDSLPTTVSITVTSVNDPPVADNDAATVLQDAAATPIPVLVGDTDPDGDTLTIDSAVQPANGTVVVAGEDITDYSQKQLTDFRREHVGFVFQGVNLIPFLTARENLLVVDEIGRRTGAAGRERADQLLEELGLADRAGHMPAELSGGQRQRVAIGRALMNDPDLVLFDEPTSALDTKLGEQVMDLIRNEMKSRGTAAIVVTHDERMTHYTDRIVHIVDGVLTE